MAALEEPKQDQGDIDLSRRNADPPHSSSPKHEAFLPAIAQTSEYIQLAKAGGHKGKILSLEIILLMWVCPTPYIADLLTHHPFVRDKDAKPVPYSRVDWWDHPPGLDVVVGKR